MRILFLTVRLLLTLSITVVAADFLKDCVSEGLLRAVGKVPMRIVDALIQVLTLPVKLLFGILGAALGLLKEIILNLFDIPLTVAWNVVPGLSLIPQPKASDLF